MGVHLSRPVEGHALFCQTLPDVIRPLIIPKYTDIINALCTISLTVYRYIDGIAPWKIDALIHIAVRYIISNCN